MRKIMERESVKSGVLFTTLNVNKTIILLAAASAGQTLLIAMLSAIMAELTSPAPKESS